MWAPAPCRYSSVSIAALGQRMHFPNGLGFAFLEGLGLPAAPPDRQQGWRELARAERGLVATLKMKFHTGTLKVTEALASRSAFREELLNLRRKIELRIVHDPSSSVHVICLMTAISMHNYV